jgi:hypothetical protein
MMRSVLAARSPLALFAVILLFCGCTKTDTGPSAGPVGGPGGPPSATKQAMMKIGKPPQSLHSMLARELQADSPSWETIQPQTKEYADLAGSLGKYDPPKGSKDSWQTLTTAYAESAADLDKAAQGKNLPAAKAAHAKLNESCMKCHMQHRGGRG